MFDLFGETVASPFDKIELEAAPASSQEKLTWEKELLGGYVSQNPFLFSNTLGANISYGATSAEHETIRQAAEQAQLLQDIDELQDGFETIIGERGVTLSGGQKQRSTLARAIIRQPQILILDDALSAVDTHTEEANLAHLISDLGYQFEFSS